MKKMLLLLLLLTCSGAQAEDREAALEEIVVSAPRPDEDINEPQAFKILSDDELRMKTGHSIGETLKDELGINSQSFGPGVGTPVIRGQGGPRVKVLNNGIGSNDVSAISPDHATSVEPLLAERIEVLRGPSTLLYGSGVIGGVVNVIDNRIPSLLPDKVAGALEQRFDSAADETSTAMKLDGGQGSVAYHLDGFYRHRDNLTIGGSAIDAAKVSSIDPSLNIVDNPKGHLSNTGAEAISGSVGASWVGESAFAGASINSLNNTYGIAPDGSGHEAVQIALRQEKYDFKSELRQPFSFAKALRMRLGYTDYQHTEIANGSPGAEFLNQTFEGRIELLHHDLGPVRGSVGFQAQDGEVQALRHQDGTATLAVEKIMPRSQVSHYAIFAVEALDVGAVTYQMATRIEQAGISPEMMASLSYTPISASASASWAVNENHGLNLALTRSSRAPQVQELLVDGYHDATRSWERGSLSLSEETSYNLDLGYRFKSPWLRAELDVFHNWASDYIYQQRSGEFVNEAGDSHCGNACVPVLLSSQRDAIFKGYEAKLILPMMENHQGLLELSLFSDYTRGMFNAGGDVPRMPPLRYGAQLDYNRGRLSSYLRLTRADQQMHAGAFETSVAGYFLLNIGVNYQVKAYQDAKLMLFAKANNLLDQNIRNATSYLRNFAPEAGRGAEVGFRISY